MARKALVALTVVVCAVGAIWAQAPAIRHSWPSLSRVERPLVTQGNETTTLPVDSSAGSPSADYSGPQPTDPIQIQSQYAWKWKEDGKMMLFLRGNCRISQGQTLLSAQEIVIWGGAEDAAEEERLTIYLEGEAQWSEPGRTVRHSSLLAHLQTREAIKLSRKPIDGSMADAATYVRGNDRRRTSRSELVSTQQVGFTPEQAFAQDGGSPMLDSSYALAYPRRVTINPRNLGADFKVHSDVDDTKSPPESRTTIQGGVNIIVENVPITVNGQLVLTRLDLSADRAVVWTSSDGVGNAGSGVEINENTPFQVYLEGDIVARQGNSVATASHAFYDIRGQRGLLVNSELRTYVPEFDTFLRIRAETIRQTSQTSFQAHNAWVTSSQFGKPGYRVQSSLVTLEERPSFWNGGVDPLTGQLATSQHLSSSGNTLFVEDVPVFYLPRISGPVEETPFPLETASAGYSGMFGTEVNTVWSVDKLFGFDLPAGTDWDLLVDGYTKRGPAIGTRGEYEAWGQFFGMSTKMKGEGLLYYVHDEGQDRLGLGRNKLDIPDSNRGRALWRNRMEMPAGVTLSSELSYIFNDDRNFLEQWYEPEWDRGKDQENLVHLSKQVDNITASVLFQTRLNDVFTQTEWLPRADLTILGEPLLGGLMTWSSRSSVGYGRLRPETPPVDPLDTFAPLTYFPEVEGLVASTRHEVSLPFDLGPVHVAPYALGEAAHWQEDMTQSDLTRLYGSAGVRASVEFWNVQPEIRSSILGLNGLAHKVVFDVDYSYSQATESLDDIPQYNAIDDDAQERFRSRFLDLEFGGVLPPQFDPRYYALRSGAGRDVTAAYHELVDDQQVLRLGMRHRWQTKEGPIENPRIKDWVTLDLEASIFPDANRDNFGETLGLLTGRSMWQVGERTQLLANAVVDPFHEGQRVWNLGLLSQRGPRGSLYFGYREIHAGPVDSRLITGSYTYRMSEKWLSTVGASFDVGEGRDRGQSLTITRIGEYMLFHVGAGYDRSRDNLSLNLMIEPRIGNKTMTSQGSSMLGNY
ncbi:MAG: hypothetical protein DWH91_13815 [Planctomycetota bacterium]|nr:MAG: hypothetical protein DWH91_13815 [Planctomycetota bacterium]